MRCHSVQALWASTPPHHEVVTMVALEDPPSLWTGGSRGEIIYWKLSSPPDDGGSGQLIQELWPMAMLCGHAAAIADVAACKLHKVKENCVYMSCGLGDEDLHHQYGFVNTCEIVVSVCVEGWLCAWDSLTGRCRRRRRLAPWIGSPRVMTTLPKDQRYVAIASDVSTSGLSKSSSINDENNEIRRLVDSARTAVLENSGSIEKNMRGTVVIVDSSTLGILQVLCNGFLGVGPVKSIMAFPQGDLVHKVIISDSVGRIRSWFTNQEKHGKHESGSEWTEWAIPSLHKNDLGSCENTKMVSFSADGLYLLLVFGSYWVILSTADQSLVQESTHLEEKSMKPVCLAGGFFLFDSSFSLDFTANNKGANCRSMFLVWDTFGSAILYSLESNPDQTFVAKDVCRIPPVIPNHETPFSVKFCQLQDLRTSRGYRQPHLKVFSTSDSWIRLWLVPLKLLCNADFQPSKALLHACDHVEKGIFAEERNCSSEIAILCWEGGLQACWLSLFVNNSPKKTCFAEQGNFKKKHFDRSDHACLESDQVSPEWSGFPCGSYEMDVNTAFQSARGKWVTASMLLSDRAAIPLTFVLGFSCGEITLIELKVFETASVERDKGGFLGNERGGEYLIQTLSKHTGPIKCLAEHSIVAGSSMFDSGKVTRRLLISGGMDCLTCIWDLEKDAQLLVVLHHNVAPVCQILLPPLGTDAPWSDCFITAGEDGCIALISLETLKVERMFVGRTVQPNMIVWDGIRGYLSCIWTSISIPAMTSDILHVWDLKSGALERILRGAPAHSMFENFLKQIQESSVTNTLFPGRATSISSFLHADVDSPRTQSVQSSSNHFSSGLGTKKKIYIDCASSPKSGQAASSPKSGQTASSPKSVQIASSPKSVLATSGNTVLPKDKHFEDFKLNSVESASSKVIGSLEKLSSRISQALNPAAKSEPSLSKERPGGRSSSEFSSHRNLFHKQPPIKGATPFPGVCALQFDLFTLMAPDLGRLGKRERVVEQLKANPVTSQLREGAANNKDNGDIMKEGIQSIDRENDLASQKGSLEAKSDRSELASSLGSFEGCLLRTSLACLHLWGADLELDRCLEKELRIFQPTDVGAAAGFAGDRGATTLLLPGWRPTFELWTISPEFCALRSLTIVATALRMTTLSRLTSSASSALAAFYSRGLAEKFPGVKPPSFELYACFWQDPSEHVRMAARSLFLCAASRAIPSILCAKNNLFIFQQKRIHNSESGINNNDSLLNVEQQLMDEFSAVKTAWPESVSTSTEINAWLDSFEGQNWTAIVGGTSQDARSGRIIVGAALAVWYPGLVKPELAPSVAPYLVKLVKAAIDRHSAVAAELLAEGMESIWGHLISSEIPQLISDMFLLIDWLSGGGTANHSVINNPATAMTIRETLTGSLLPSLAVADITSFLRIVQTQLSAASADSSVHLVALMTIIRIVRGAPRAVVYYLGQVTSIILQTMNSGKHCFQSAMATVRELARVYPMVAVHQGSGKLAVGDAVGDVRSLAIQVYDLNSASKLRTLDASGPPGHPALLVSDGTSANIGGISALIFSEDGEGVVAFSQHGLMIRWWSIGGVWWERLSRVTAPVQCTKLVLVPPWTGFSPKSSQSSIMATISKNSEKKDLPEEVKGRIHEDNARGPCPNVDLSFRLEWKQERKISLLHHGQDLGVFQL